MHLHRIGEVNNASSPPILTPHHTKLLHQIVVRFRPDDRNPTQTNELCHHTCSTIHVAPYHFLSSNPSKVNAILTGQRRIKQVESNKASRRKSCFLPKGSQSCDAVLGTSRNEKTEGTMPTGIRMKLTYRKTQILIDERYRQQWSCQWSLLVRYSRCR